MLFLELVPLWLLDKPDSLRVTSQLQISLREIADTPEVGLITTVSSNVEHRGADMRSR